MIDFKLSGEGEHFWLYLEKTRLNTQQVAKELGKFYKIPRKNIGYSGLKDKIAVTRQWFSIWLPGKQGKLEYGVFSCENCLVIQSGWHHKKLKKGTHKFNHFKIIVRDLKPPLQILKNKINMIRDQGFVNCYGSQRFGEDEVNLVKAIAYIKGEYEVKSRIDCDFYLSVLRSYLFDQYLAIRSEAQTFNQVLLGDVVGFLGKNTWFAVSDPDQIDDVQKRVDSGELVIAGPLYGMSQKLMLSGEALSLWERVLEESPWHKNLLSQGMMTQYRALVVKVFDLNDKLVYPESLCLDFKLQKGCYATTMLEAMADV